MIVPTSMQYVDCTLVERMTVLLLCGYATVERTIMPLLCEYAPEERITVLLMCGYALDTLCLKCADIQIEMNVYSSTSVWIFTVK